MNNPTLLINIKASIIVDKPIENIHNFIGVYENDNNILDSW